MKTRHVGVAVNVEAPFEALFLSDSHLPLCDCRDGDRKAALAAGRNAEMNNAPRYLEEALGFAESRSALLLHAGDLIDFTSAANFDAAKRCFSRGKWILACVGNHEFSQFVGEAEENATYRAQSAAAVQAVWPNDIDFASKVVNGVNFVALDNSYYRFSEFHLVRMKAEVEKGLPIVMLCHVPLHAPGHYANQMRRTGGICAYECGVPDGLVDSWRKEREWPENERWRDRRVQQRSDKATNKFIEYLRAQPLLKAVLTGHTHAFWEERFSSTAVQFTCPALFNGEALSISFDKSVEHRDFCRKRALLDGLSGRIARP